MSLKYEPSSPGHGHTLWLSDLGAVFSAGRNDGGQLGVGDSIDRMAVQAVTVPLRVWCDTPFGSEISQTYADWVTQTQHPPTLSPQHTHTHTHTLSLSLHTHTFSLSLSISLPPPLSL